MPHAKILTMLVLVVLSTPGCLRDLREVSELYELDTNRYRLEAIIGMENLDTNDVVKRKYAEERKLLYHKAKEHCDKNSKRLKVYSLGQQTLGTASSGVLAGVQGVIVGGSSSVPVADAMVIEFGCFDK